MIYRYLSLQLDLRNKLVNDQWPSDSVKIFRDQQDTNRNK